MATTLRLSPELASGILNASGAVLASGVVHIYDPGTTNVQTVYSDSAGSSAYTQPITLDAYGRKNVWIKNSARILIKDSTDTTTLYDWDPGSQVRAEQVMITNSYVNGGTETTLNAALTAGLGIIGSYLEGSAATSRTFSSWMKENVILVTDYGAIGDGVTDDTAAIQAALDRALAADRTSLTLAHTVVVLFPMGTWKISTQLQLAILSGTKQIIIRGQGSKSTVISQSGTAANGLYINYTSTTSARVLVEDLRITAATTSSLAGIKDTNGNKTTIRNCNVALFRTGIDVAGATKCRIENCEVESTDGNAAAVGISAGTSTRILECIVTGSSSLGTGISSSSTDVAVVGGEVSGFLHQIAISGARARVRGTDLVGTATGTTINLTGANSRALDVYISGAGATGVSLGAANTSVIDSYITAHTTGVAIGAFSGCKVTGNDIASNTTEYTRNSSATNLVMYGNITVTGEVPIVGSYATQSTGSTGNITPVLHGGPIYYNRIQKTGAGGSVVITIVNTATTDLIDGCILRLNLCIANGASVTGLEFAFGNQYQAMSGGLQMANITGVDDDYGYTVEFIWRASASQWWNTICTPNEIGAS